MKKVAIVDARILTCLGDLDQTWSSLLANRSGLKKIEANLAVDKFYGVIDSIKADFGGANRASQIIDKCLRSDLFAPKGSAVVLATTKGAVDDLAENQPRTLTFQPWNLHEQIRLKFGADLQISTISAACASGTLAIIQAVNKIVSGEHRFVWVIGFDLLSNFVSQGFDKLKALSKDKCKPFDRNRDGLCLGEGCGAILLADPNAAEEYKLETKAFVSGWGTSCDAVHITAPSRTAEGLIDSIKQTIGNNKEIGAINAHGTGTNFNDAMEMYAFNKIWQPIPPVHSLKGAIGHCLGAAGVIETAIAVKSLQEGFIPPTVGLEVPDPLLGESAVTGKAVKLSHPSILKCNSGFGGINASILLEK